MECNICEQQKTKLYCTKCVKEGIRQQKYQIQAVSQKREGALKKVIEHLSSDARKIWLLHAERDEKKVLVSSTNAEIERLHGLVRKGGSCNVDWLMKQNGNDWRMLRLISRLGKVTLLLR